MNMRSEANKIPNEPLGLNAELFSQIIDSLNDYSIFTIDKDLNIVSWSAGAVRTFKYTSDDVLDKPYETILTQENRKESSKRQEDETALSSRKFDDPRWYKRKDGTVFYADSLTFPLKNEDHAIIGYVKVLRDVTEKKASEDAVKKYAKELEDLNTHKENVLAILSHDLRSPLAGIIQGAEYLRENYEGAEPSFVKELLDEFHTAVVHELDMLDYLVEWARIKYVSEAFVPTKLDLVHCVKKVFEFLKETALIKQITLKSTVEDGTKVYADGKMVISILHNIVSNAIKYSYKGGEITISANKKDDMILIEVRDMGRGMSKEIKNKLFTPQVKALSKTLEENKGTGIGLMLAKGFIEKNGGRIWVESQIGKGSSFYFTLPINKPLDISVTTKSGDNENIQSHVAC